MLPQKECPQCKTLAALDAPACARCGRVYRTQFVHGAGIPPPATEIAPPAVRRHSNLIPILVLVFIPVGLILFGLLSVVRPHGNQDDPTRPVDTANTMYARGYGANSGVIAPEDVRTIFLHCSGHQVLLGLGQPKQVNVGRDGAEPSGYETWIYDIAGGGQLVLLFRQGELIKIDQMDASGIDRHTEVKERSVSEPAQT